MKTLRLVSLASFSALFFLASCTADDLRDLPVQSDQKTNPVIESGSNQQTSSSQTGRIASVAACNAYAISLESKTQVGSNWEWIWTVQNLNPGNGNSGTVQDLSHWGMQFGSCFVWSSVVGAAYSADGITWTSFTPVYQIDPSQTCMTTPVLKFDFGTTGGNASYYKLLVNQDYQSGYVPGYYKSGNRTGCCIFNFVGIGCPGIAEER